MVSPSQLSSRYLSFSVSKQFKEIATNMLWNLCCRHKYFSYYKVYLPGLEVMGPAYRTGAGLMLCMFFAVALMILSLLSYLFNSWFQLALVTSLPFTILAVYWWQDNKIKTETKWYFRWFVPESPRWLLSTGRIDEAEVVVQKIAKWNKKDIPANFIHQLVSLIQILRNYQFQPHWLSGEQD